MKIRIIGVPSALGLHPDWNPEGAEKLAEALRNAGLVDRLTRAGLEVEDSGDIPVPKYNYAPDPETRLYNKNELAVLSRSLTQRVDESLRSGFFPLILAGDCSALIGSLAGLSSIQSLGLFYLDAHCDFYTPETTGFFVFSSIVFVSAPMSYFAHIASLYSKGTARWRSTTTTLASASPVPNTSFTARRYSIAW